MQAILVIRVYALFNQSKKISVFLATFYVLQATTIFVMMGLIADKRVFDRLVASVGLAIGSVTQAVSNTSAFPSALNEDSTILCLVFDAILLLFALWAFVKHALEAKALDGGWSANVLVRTLVADHLLYFVCNLVWLWLSLAATEYNTAIVVSGPHMVISLRTTESKTRGEGGTFEGEISTIRFDARGLSTQVQSVIEEGGGLRAVDEIVEID
ncbi:hypothetical protein BJ138DRAFT_1119656 [Hygrophoropsis aurantiaca]|uniref:Uncharacterized protein n=1 Tax=Hygrophoropsis aurantiaca TaxID=72124 RepID=A0ACB7ZTL5_9AGAM|nr:hypothetical protein BJ138DRAFT_1119656 [Hygrophoropsis aurantiaca]